ncbi:hypothetical protein EGR_04726 [Echinococcus granulosus]|uniref:Uncharacterized protein n=1 Tax=Echinococcus granulosus TaxID=6210 RepID=W6V2X4_ECHGR|nr:hypothetical protein EGR_04726 [Echinococcus granulosus]EUB60344.1 hypothetical protein EGR_04726 [Echinococcus granulosus]
MDGTGQELMIHGGCTVHEIACFECGGAGGDPNAGARTHFSPHAAAHSHPSPTEIINGTTSHTRTSSDDKQRLKLSACSSASVLVAGVICVQLTNQGRLQQSISKRPTNRLFPLLT